MIRPGVACSRILTPTKVSARFVTQRHENSAVASYLTKFALVNFQDTLKSVPELENNFRARNRTPKINLITLKNLGEILEKHFLHKRAFREKMCAAEQDDQMDEAPKSKNFGKYVEGQFKIFDTYYKHLKEVIVGYYLTVPNRLLDRTPRGEEDTVVSEKLFSVPGDKTTVQDHLSVGSNLGVLQYSDPKTYYLLKDAAMVEVAVPRFLNDVLENEMNFRPFRNPDTCNEFVIEGTGLENLEEECFPLEDNDYLCLVGGASLSAFCAYRTANSVRSKFLPERFYTHGRCYIPSKSSHENGLYTVCQRTNVHLCLAAASAEQLMSEFDSTLHSLTSVYDRLRLDYRVCYAKASELTIAESCRAKIQLFSPYRKCFVDIGRLSVYDDFISQRLRMFYHTNSVDKYFLHLLDGIAISVPVLIANLLERSVDKMLIPDCIRPYMFCNSSK